MSTFAAEIAGGVAQRHGCAWFIADAQGRRDPNTAGGWWAVGGGPAQRFASWRELPERVVWWTNLTRPEAWALGRWSQFKEGSLFGPDWPSLMTESGHGAADEAIAAAVSSWSETFARCAEWLADWARQHDPSKPWEWGEGTVADALAPRLGWNATEAEEPGPVLQTAYVETIEQEVPSNFLVGKRRVVLAFPRVAHAQAIWKTRFPQGAWREIKDWPRPQEERLAWLRAQQVPLLVRVVSLAWRPGQEADGMLWLGLRGRRFPASEADPLWLTGEEAVVLGTFADLVIDDGYQAPGWQTLAAPEGWPMGSSDPMVGLSWSQALLATAAWRSAASPTRDPSRRRRSWTTSRAIWWHAADRARCFRAAWALQKKGWTVVSYGLGQVVLLIDPADAAAPLAEAIADQGLLMPALVAKLAPLRPEASHDQVHQVDRWLKQASGVVALLDVDRLVAPWSGTAAEVRGVLEPAAQRLLAVSPVPNPEWAAWWRTSLNQQARKSVDRLKTKTQSSSR